MKSSFDPKAPKALTDIQSWFGSIITQKMVDGFEISPTTPSGASIVDEAKKYLHENDALAAHTRMQLYNQSYWLRLLAALHEEFPFVVRLFGEDDFNNTLGIPYLDDYPPNHWSLNSLGKDFIKWIETNYQTTDKNFVIMAAKLDWAYQKSFFTKPLPLIDLTTFANEKAKLLFSTPLVLQSHTHLFSFPSHLLNYRETFLKQTIDFWVENDFPPLYKDKEYFFIIYRGTQLQVEWEELSFEEYQLLLHIEKGNSVESAIALLENNDSIDQKLVEEELAFWVQKWLLRQFLSINLLQDGQFALQVVDEKQTNET